MFRKTKPVLAAAVAALATPALSLATTVDGIVTAGEYGPNALALQGTATGYGDNQSELDGLYATYAPGGSLNFALTGNLTNNGIVVFLDTRSGGGIANTAGGGYNQFGSVGGERSDDWGTDIDGGDGVTPTPGGGSVLNGGFNPEKTLELGLFGGTYYIHVIDLTQPNDSTHPNKDVWLNAPGSTPGNTSTTNTYFRDNGATLAGDVTHAFDNTNTQGVTSNPMALGDPATATTGFEATLDSLFTNHEPGKAVRVMAAITNGDGMYLSNQFLPKLHYQDSGNLDNAGGWGGNPLADVRTDAFSGDSFITIWEPTFTAGADNKWSTAGNWAGNFAPNGVEHDAAFVGAGGAVDLDLDVTVGSLKFAGSGGYTVSTTSGKTITINAGSAAGRIDVGAFSNVVNPKVIIASDTRVNLGVADVTLNEIDNSAAKRITVAGAGTVNINGPQTNGVGAGIAIDSGTVNFNSDGGAPGVLNQDVFVSGTANFNVTQHLRTLGVNGGGLATLAANGGNRSITANNIFVNNGGKLNVGDGKLISKTNAVGTVGTGNTYDGMTGLIQAGRGTGSWDGTTGILTSQTAATTSSFTSIGIATAAQAKLIASTATAVWAGQTVTGTDTLVMYTYGGDANLDGKLNVDDYGRIDSNIGLGTAGWYNGDFNYDGKVNVDDYGIIDSNIGIQGAPFPTGAGVAAGLSAVSAVPEPSSVALIALGAAALLARGRRRRPPVHL
jgi:hypothetical protein